MSALALHEAGGDRGDVPGACVVERDAALLFRRWVWSHEQTQKLPAEKEGRHDDGRDGEQHAEWADVEGEAHGGGNDLAGLARSQLGPSCRGSETSPKPDRRSILALCLR